jgi:hypothetical protein
MTYKTGNFVELGEVFVNFDQVQQFKYTDDGRVWVQWANGDDAMFRVNSGIDMDRYFIVPAAPGFELLSYWPDPAEGQVLERSPVVAWRIDEDQTVERFGDENLIAISLNGTSKETSKNMRVAVLAPNGGVTHYQNCRQWVSIDEWRDWADEDWREKQEEEEKENAA